MKLIKGKDVSFSERINTHRITENTKLPRFMMQNSTSKSRNDYSSLKGSFNGVVHSARKKVWSIDKSSFASTSKYSGQTQSDSIVNCLDSVWKTYVAKDKQNNQSLMNEQKFNSLSKKHSTKDHQKLKVRFKCAGEQSAPLKILQVATTQIKQL